jgi:hypothetical protein
MDGTETQTPLDSPTGLVGAHTGKRPQMPNKYEGHGDTHASN